jgi:hypothetical protein
MRYHRLKRFKRNQCLTPENQDKTNVWRRNMLSLKGRLFSCLRKHSWSLMLRINIPLFGRRESRKKKGGNFFFYSDTLLSTKICITNTFFYLQILTDTFIKNLVSL